MSADRPSDGWGCGGCRTAFLALGAVVAAVISIAALIDPFSWMPSIDNVWAECDDDYATSSDECDLATRYPGFWAHALINFGYVVLCVVALLWLASTVLELREARRERFSGEDAASRYEVVRGTLVLAACVCAGSAALPILAVL